MRLLRRWTVLLPLLTAGATGCAEPGSPAPATLAAIISITPAADTLFLSQQVQLTAAIQDADGTTLDDRTVRWTSSNTAIVTVDQSGLVVARAPGIASITAVADTASAIAPLTILVPIAQITITPEADTIPLGQSVQLSATARDTAGNILSDRVIHWAVLDTSRATVDPNGLVTIHGPGTFQIVAFAEGRSTTAPISSFISYDDLSAGLVHGCGLSGTKRILCWGLPWYRATGNPRTCSYGCNLPFPIDAPGLTFKQVTSGVFFSCALETAGTAVCWGWDQHGQLGRGNAYSSDSALPAVVAGGKAFTSLSAGDEHVCGITTSSTNGNVWCWGSGAFGQLGIPVPVYCGSPAGIPCSSFPVAAGIDLVQVSAGSRHTCGVDIDGAAYCWGSNLYGELGVDSSVSLICQVGSPPWPCSDTPVGVTGGLTFSSIATGTHHTCGLTRSQQVYCWGYNDYGELGTGNQTTSPIPQLVSGLPAIEAVFAGGAHSCALSTSKVAYCWGSNLSGEVGASPFGGTCSIQGFPTYCRVSPVPVMGGISFHTLRLGGTATCGIATTGVSYCWGSNQEGQLGSQGAFYSQPIEIHGQR